MSLNHLQQSLLLGIAMYGVKCRVKLLLSLHLLGATLLFLYSCTMGTLRIQSSLCRLQQRCGTAARLFSGDGHGSEVSYLFQINYLIQYLFRGHFSACFHLAKGFSYLWQSDFFYHSWGPLGKRVFIHWRLLIIFALQYVLQPSLLKICCSVKHSEQKTSNSIEYHTVTLWCLSKLRETLI